MTNAIHRLLRFGRAAKEHALPVWKSTQLRSEPSREWLWLQSERGLQWLKLRPRVVFWAGAIGVALALAGWAVMPLIKAVWHWYGRNRENLAPLLALFGSLVVGLGTITVGALVARAALRQARTAIQVAEIANRQAEIASRRHEEQTRADQQRRITESFSKAVEQLGSDKLEVRLGGIYSLERISRESPEDYWTVMENLTAFVRERSRRNEAERTALDLEQRVLRRAYFLWREAGQPEGRADDFWADAAKGEELGEPPATDIAAVLTVIKRRSERSREREGANAWRLDLSKAFLKRADLSGAHLEAANLSAVDFRWADLRDAHLEGASLGGAHLERANLRDAHLESAFLWYAHLEGASLWHTHLEGTDLVNTVGLLEDQLLDAYADAWTNLPPGLVRPTHWPKQRDRDQELRDTVRDAMVRFSENAGESASRMALMASLKALWDDLNPPEVSGNASAGSPANEPALPAGLARRRHTGPAPPA